MGWRDVVRAMLGPSPAPPAGDARADSSPIRPASGLTAGGWINGLTGMGFAATDPTASTSFARAPILPAESAWAIYEGDGLAARVVDLPAAEALRQGWHVSWDGDADADARIHEWAATVPIGPDGQAGLDVILSRWLAWRGIFGGAAIVILSADGRPTSEPLDEARPHIVGLRLLSRHDLYRTGSRLWTVVGTGQTYHPSRLLLLGREARPLSIADARDGWSVSVYERIYRTLAACGTADASAAALLSRFGTPVQRMRGLAEALAQGGEAVLERMGLEQLIRSTYRVTLLDGEHESYETQSPTLSGLPELMDRFPERVSAATGIPMTLLMGHAPAGLSTDDQSGRRFFYDSIKAGPQTRDLAPALRRLLTLAMRDPSGPTQGVEPAAWSLDFAPLYQLDALEQEDLLGKQATRDAAYIAAGVLTTQEVRQARFGGQSGDVSLLPPPPLQSPASPATPDSGTAGGTP